ncbi:nucleotide-diphospho-sugar transferase [Neoconidiobolus thromboides FSU 785]|nr:nucleotide-diphospho-sugar transferase [Neoconidiobolus thromboides FSU 785]
MSVKAAILVGGPSRGTRFRPLSLDLPKPLFPIGGEPVIYHHLVQLSKVKELNEVYLIGFFEDSVFAPFLNKVKADFPNLNVKYLREYQAMGTAGGIYHFRDEFRRGNPKQIFVIHADVCASLPFESIIEDHNTSDRLCTIVGTKVSREEAKNYGCLVADSNTNEVLHYVEKPETFISDLISCGVYLFDTSVFDEIKLAKEKVDTRDTHVASDVLRLEQDLLQPLAGSKKIYVYSINTPWRQLSTASSAIPSNALYLEEMAKANSSLIAKNGEKAEIVGNVSIHPSATIGANVKLGPNVSIGPNVVLEDGVRIRESIILDNVQVKSDACIVHSIIGWGSSIGRWVRIQGSFSDGHSTITKNGIKIQSTTILGKEVKVKDELIIRNCLVLPNKELKENFHNEILM